MSFTSEHSDKLKQHYNQYLVSVRPLVTLIEARTHQFPVPILNEIRAFHDHIARCYQDHYTEEQISSEIDKAKSHIKRMLLDCFKMLCFYSNDQITKFEKQYENVDLTLVSNGEFANQLTLLSHKASKLIKEAKDAESIGNFSLTYELFEKAYNTYEELIQYIDDNLVNVKWVKTRARNTSIKKTILTILISGIISSILVEILAPNGWSQVWNNLISLINKVTKPSS